MAGKKSSATKATTASSTSRKSTKKATVETPVETKQAAVVVTETPVQLNTNETTQPVEGGAQQDQFLATLSNMRTRLTSFEKDFREMRGFMKTLETEYKRKSKLLEASQNKRFSKTQRTRKTSDNRVVSGIARPTQISSELAKFLNCDPEKPLARTEAIKGITAYIKTNKLENPEYRRQIIPDDALGKLLNWEIAKKEVDELSYFNIQKLLKHHFPKQHGTEAPGPVVETKKVTKTKTK